MSTTAQTRLRRLRMISRAAGVIVLAAILWPVFRWGVLDAVFSGETVAACQVDGIRREGACWPVVTQNMGLFLGGRFPEALLWRPALVVLLGLLSLLGPLLARARPALFFLAPLVAFPVQVFLMTGAEGLQGVGLGPVSSEQWGGFALTWLLSAGAILGSLIPGLLLALARLEAGKGRMRILGAVATGFIEVVRGVPLITLLFVGHFLFPLFLPQGGLNLDAIFRAGLALTVFLSVYSAEVWRGGFLAIHKGQEEAASALGLRGPQKLRYVLLPQATRVALPGLVATFIGLFKDTSLVTIVGVFDLLGVVRAIPRSSAWLGVDVEPFVFAAAVYAGIGILMTRLGRSLSSKWST